MLCGNKQQSQQHLGDDIDNGWARKLLVDADVRVIDKLWQHTAEIPCVASETKDGGKKPPKKKQKTKNKKKNKNASDTRHKKGKEGGLDC